MISKIVYGNYVKGVLDYVIDKNESKIIGFGNTYSKHNTDRFFFKTTLEYLNSKTDGDKKVAHMILNLPVADKVSDETFYNISKDYLEGMGYKDQPFIVVKHNDKKHSHVHIITSRVKEDMTKISMSRDYLKSMDLTAKLEAKYSLTKTNHIRNDRELPILSQHHNIKTDKEDGLKYYLEDTISRIVQKYQITSFKQLEKELIPYSIKTAVSIKDNDRVGVSFGIIDEDNNYNDRVIAGSRLHKKLSFPNLDSIFQKNLNNSLRKKRRTILKRQMSETFDSFKTISVNDLPSVLKTMNNIDAKINLSKDTGKVIGYTIYDKSGYIFTASEIDRSFSVNNNSNPITTSSKTFITLAKDSSKAYLDKALLKQLELYHLEHQRPGISEYNSYQNINSKDIQNDLLDNQSFVLFYNSLSSSDKKQFNNVLNERFKIVKERALERAKKREEFQLNKIVYIFEATNNILKSKPTITQSKLAQSLGGYLKGNILSLQSNDRQFKKMSNIKPNDSTELYTYNPTGFQVQNLYLLSGIKDPTARDVKFINQNSFFLPMIYPELYASLNSEANNSANKFRLASYLSWESKKDLPFIQNASELVTYFSTKGFLIQKDNNGYKVTSAYTGNTSHSLPLKFQKYLDNSNDIVNTLNNGHKIYNKLKDTQAFKLTNLWATHLTDKGIYDKAAYLLVKEDAVLLYNEKVLDHHNGQGLNFEVQSLKNSTFTNRRYNQMSNKSKVISALLGPSSNEDPREMHNGFKDELTDYSKYKGINY